MQPHPWPNDTEAKIILKTSVACKQHYWAHIYCMGLSKAQPNPTIPVWAWSPSLSGEVKKAGEEKQWKRGSEPRFWSESGA